MSTTPTPAAERVRKVWRDNMAEAKQKLGEAREAHKVASNLLAKKLADSDITYWQARYETYAEIVEHDDATRPTPSAEPVADTGGTCRIPPTVTVETPGFTPGPWHASFDWAHDRENGVAICNDATRDWKNPVARVLYLWDDEVTEAERAEMIANGDSYDVDEYDDDTAVTEANARLIAAAPDLYAACNQAAADAQGIANLTDDETVRAICEHIVATCVTALTAARSASGSDQ